MDAAASDSSHAQEWPVQAVEANGVRFAYLERGSGPLVLCFHGFPDSAWSFRHLLNTLAAAGYRAVAPFMRGYAPTDVPSDGDYRIATLGRDAIALIEHLGAPNAAIVGHDWGAATAYAAAALRPDRVRAVVTAAVPHLRRFLLGPSLRQLRRSRYMGYFQLSGISDRRVVADDCAYIDNLVREWSPGWDFDPQDFAAVKASLREPARCAALLGYYRAMPGSLLSREAWQLLMTPLPVRARVVRGERDGCIGREMFEDQSHCFGRGFELAEIAGAGHFMHLERPVEFAHQVATFL